MKKTLLSALILGSVTSAYAKQVFHTNIGSDPKTIDPQHASETAGGAVLRDIFEGLLTVDASGNPIPGVAEKWEVGDDLVTYTFHLRKDAKWSNGDPVTASDFVYAWRRAVDPNTASVYSFILDPVKNAQEIIAGKLPTSSLGITALDDRTLKVTLKQPTPYFLGLLSFYTTYPTHRATVEKYGKKWTRPENIVSNGPYSLTEWKPSAKIKLEKNPYYYDKDQLKIDEVSMDIIENEESAVKRYRAGELDIVGATNEAVDWAKKNAPNELRIEPALGTYMYLFNLNDPALKDKRLRKALNMAIDRDLFVKYVAKNGEIPATGVVPPNTANSDPYKPEWASWSKQRREDEARKLYKEAGYSKENPFKVELLYNTSEGHKKYAVAVTSMWKDVLGVKSELINKEWKVMLADQEQGKFQTVRYGWIGDYNDPNTFLELFKSTSKLTDSGFSSPEFDKAMNEAAKTIDLKERAKILNRAEKILIEDYAIVPLYFYVSRYLIKPYVKGYKPNIMGDHLTRWLSIEK